MENKPSIPNKIKEEIWNFLAECKYDGKITKMNIDSIYNLFASQISKLEADLKEKEEEIVRLKEHHSDWLEAEERADKLFNGQMNVKDSHIDDLEKELERRKELLSRLEDYFDDRADVQDGDNEDYIPRPNTEMCFLNEIRETLK